MTNLDLQKRIASLSRKALTNNQLSAVDALCRLGLILAPNSGIFYHHLGLSALIEDDTETALPLLIQSLANFANEQGQEALDAHKDAAIALLMHNKHEEASDLIEKAQTKWKQDFTLNYLAAQASEKQGATQRACEAYEIAFNSAPDEHPDKADIAFNLANLYHKTQKLSAAYTYFRKAIELAPLNKKAWCNLGNLLSDMARPDEAVKAYEGALRIDPTYAQAHSNLLQTLHYLPNQTAASLLPLHKAWAKQHTVTTETKYAPIPAQKKLCVGLVSEDLRQHPVGYFCKGWLPHAKEAGLEIIVYCSNRTSDELTYAMKAHVDKWLYVDEFSDNQLCQQIRHDVPDVLLDLAGHTGRNRLQVFAQSPAAKQATWMGYVGTTGIPQIHGLIADRIHVPKFEEKCYTEDIWRMPNGYICYAPPESSPEPESEAWKRNSHVRFAAFHNPAKINATLIATWAKILHEVENSQICFAYRGYGDPAVQEHISLTFQAHGISPQRLDFRAAMPHYELLQLYNDCDFALDSFPYSGGLTTLEALWMGIPVITTPGRIFASRHSASHLTFSGFGQEVTSTVSEYVRTAIAWAHSPLMRDADRKARRARFASSPLCDGKQFAHDLVRVLSSRS